MVSVEESSRKVNEVIKFYTLSAFNAAGDLCGFWTVDTYAALCSIPRIAGMTYVFDWVS